MADLSLNLNASDLKGGGLFDLRMVNGDFVLTSDANTAGTNNVAQAILTRLRWFLGEWFLNTGGGTPWYQSILKYDSDQAEVDAVIQEVILSTPGVLVLTAYKGEANLPKRFYRVSFTVQTSAGVVSYTLPLSVTGS